MLQSNVVGLLLEYAAQSGQGNARRDQGDAQPTCEVHTFEDLCLPAWTEMITYARRLAGGNLATAEDVVQDAYTRALEAWERWQPNGDPHACARAWLYKIVLNTYVKVYHRKSVRLDAARYYREEILVGTYGTIDEPDARDALDGGLGDEVREALASLSTDHRRVIEMHYFDGMSSEAIAAELGISAVTVRTRLLRARTQLAKRLGAYATTCGLNSLDGAGEDPAEPAKRPQANARTVDRIVGHLDAAALVVP